MSTVDFLFVVNVGCDNPRVVKWAFGKDAGEVIVGGNGVGTALNQLELPMSILVNHDGAVVVSDSLNHCVVKWAVGADIGEVIAGGHGQGAALNQLSHPLGVVIGHDGTLFIADKNNHRVVK